MFERGKSLCVYFFEPILKILKNIEKFERGNSLGVHFIEPILTLGEMSRAKKLTGIDTESIFNCAFKNIATRDQDTKVRKSG